jgi:hypothetical protein
MKIIEGNGDNEFFIAIKCECQVFRDEWLDVLFAVEKLLRTYQNGDYKNMDANLEYTEKNNIYIKP